MEKYNINEKINVTIDNLDKMDDEIAECFIAKVEGLKLILYVLESGIFVSFYFS